MSQGGLWLVHSILFQQNVDEQSKFTIMALYHFLLQGYGEKKKFDWGSVHSLILFVITTYFLP